MTVDFGKTAEDYARYRAGFPDAFFDALAERALIRPGTVALDQGTGTGTVARGLALRGCTVTALDPSEAMLERAAALDQDAGVAVDYRRGKAEETGLPGGAFDLVTAGQCWHWFHRSRAAAEARRVLKPGGALVIAHFDWLPLPGTVVAATEALILAHNPDWAGAGGTGLYPAWLGGVAAAGFTAIEAFSFDLDVPYGHEAWRGRIRASAGVAASLPPEAVAAFDKAHGDLLRRDFPGDPVMAPHRVWAMTARAPA